MKKAARPKSPLGRILAADGASSPILRRGGISACVRLETDDWKRHEQGGGKVHFSPHVLLKIPLTATQREIRAAVKELLAHLSALRAVLDEKKLRAIAGCFEEGRAALSKTSGPRGRRRALDTVLARVAEMAELAADKTVAELRREGHASYGSGTPTAALRGARNRWIRRRFRELGRDGLTELERCDRIHDELEAMLADGKAYAGRSSWKRDPYPLGPDTILKIVRHKRM